MHSVGVFFSTHCLGLVKYSRKSKRLTALVACVPLVQKDSWSLRILISVNRILGRIKSSRFIRAKVDFHGNPPTSILYFFYEESYLELSPFVVKPMFWFSIWTNQITGNYISSSGCGPDCFKLGSISSHFVRPRSFAHTMAGSLVCPIVFSTNQRAESCRQLSDWSKQSV